MARFMVTIDARYLDDDDRELDEFSTAADGEFIAHAPEDIRALLEEVTELHVKLDYTQFQIEEVKALHTPFIEQVGDMPPREMCSECNQPHPCPTMRALGIEE